MKLAELAEGAMMLRRIGLVLIAAACVRLTGSAHSESPQARFRTAVDLVRLDVSVLDRDRRPVRGLTAEDFVVLEDRQPQSIAAFWAVDGPDASVPAHGWLRDVASDVTTNQLDVQRIVVILMDDGMTESDPGTARAARRIAEAVIDRLGPNDLAAVVFTLQGRSQNFTRDRRQLLAAAETFVPKSPAAPNPFNAASYFSTNPAMAPQPPVACSYAPGRNCLTETLQAVASVLEDTPVGRKTIVLISSGVPYQFSLGNLEAAGDLDALRRTFRSLQLANVNVYPFDPTGLTAAGMLGSRFDSLRMLAENTGGRPTLATNTPWEHVSQVFIENTSYYLLGIRPSNPEADGRFRRLTVKVRRPDVEVRTRAGYYAPRGLRQRPGALAAPTTGLDKAFAAALPSGSLPLSVTLAPFALPNRKEAVIAITVGVRRPVADEVSVEKLEVRAAAFDNGFKQRATHRQTVELTLRPNVAGERRVDIQSRLTVRPGRYEVRVAAEAAQIAGGVFMQIDVPDLWKPRLSVSGLVLGRPQRPGSDVLADLIPVVPTAARVFPPTLPVTAFLRVYQGGKDPARPIEVRARIVDAANRPAFEETGELGAALFGTARAADYRLELPLARLGGGEHLLTIEATDARATVRRDVRFTVERH
jgi:VWFA-related protein